LLELVKAKGMPVHVIGGPAPKLEPTSDEGVKDERGGLPD